MNLLVQDRASKRGARGQRIPRILAHKLTIRTNGPLRIAFFLRLLSDLKKLRRRAEQARDGILSRAGYRANLLNTCCPRT